jgi:hypothetical protein
VLAPRLFFLPGSFFLLLALECFFLSLASDCFFLLLAPGCFFLLPLTLGRLFLLQLQLYLLLPMVPESLLLQLSHFLMSTAGGYLFLMLLDTPDGLSMPLVLVNFSLAVLFAIAVLTCPISSRKMPTYCGAVEGAIELELTCVISAIERSGTETALLF